MSAFFFNSGQKDDTPSYHEDIDGVAVSDNVLILVSTIGFASLGIVLYCLFLRSEDGISGDDDNDDDNYARRLVRRDVTSLNRAQRKARAKHDAESQDGDSQTNLSRRERLKVAKAKEKAYSEMARKMRERKASKKSDEPAKVANIRLEEVLPKQIDDCDDILGHQVFWGPIARSIKEKAEASDDWNETLLQAVEMVPKMTAKEFIHQLKRSGKVSVSALAGEYNISVGEVLHELETLNQRGLGIVGLFDGVGYFVFISKEMIDHAKEICISEGIIRNPHGKVSIGLQ